MEDDGFVCSGAEQLQCSVSAPHILDSSDSCRVVGEGLDGLIGGGGEREDVHHTITAA